MRKTTKCPGDKIVKDNKLPARKRHFAGPVLQMPKEFMENSQLHHPVSLGASGCHPVEMIFQFVATANTLQDFGYATVAIHQNKRDMR